MGATKTKQYSKKNINLAKIANALAHPARLTIVEILKEHKMLRNVEFQTILQLSPSTIHTHMQKLISAEIIKINYLPHQYIVHLIPEKLEELDDFINN